MSERKEIPKPTDWPNNGRECALENIWISLTDFLENPNYRTKEVLVSLVCHHDLNQDSQIGLHRITDYEVQLINSLYVYAGAIHLNCLKTYLYDIIHKLTRENILISKMLNNNPTIEAYKNLINPLKFYHCACFNFYIDREKTFAEQIEFLITNQLGDESDAENIFYTTHSYITVLNDISYFNSKKTTPLWAFSREEIFKLLKLAANLVKMNNESPVVRPLKGVLMTMISNYVLKSRTDYNEDNICKYIAPEIAIASIQNHQIWLSNIQKLNDDREMAVIPELFKNSDWIDKEWAKEIKFNPTRTYYVSSFSKAINSEEMKKKYGQGIYGYKDDRIMALIAPIYFSKDSPLPHLAQVIAFDVLYDKNEAKNEIAYLCNIIDLFDMSAQDKKLFLEEIMQYWILSVKDEEWSTEEERRYTIFMYDEYDYIETEMNDCKLLKIKTSLFLTPDFVLGNNPSKSYIRRCIDNKRSAISVKNYLYCKDCFSRDFDYYFNSQKRCVICDSSNIELVEI